MWRELIWITAVLTSAQLRALSPEARVATVSYRLQTRGAGLCDDLGPMASFFINDANSAIIESVVEGTPAERAGLHAGDRLTTINGTPVPARGVADLIDTALDSGAMDIQLASGGLAHIPVERGCAFAVSIDPSHALDAYADGKAVGLSQALVAFTRDDDELALVIGHELAHNILKHKALLDAAHVKRGLLASFGKNADAIRKTEQEADVMALYLMARSGYETTKAPTFWARFGAKTGAGIFSDGTHLRTRARVTLAETVIAEIGAKRARGAPLTPDKPVLK